jgi:hypothetical protein
MLAPVYSGYAGSIGINFSSGLIGDLGPTDEPGVAPGGNWNNVHGKSGVDMPLNDNSGAATTARLTFTASSATCFSLTTSTANPATNTIYLCSLNGNDVAGEVIVTITGIPYQSYDLYAYTPLTTAIATMSITDGKTTFYYRSDGTYTDSAKSLLLASSTDPLNPTTGQGLYQVFSGLSGRA